MAATRSADAPSAILPPQALPPLAQIVAARDWSGSPLGPPSSWTAALRTTFCMMLKTHAETVLFWGPEFAALYNDAYAPTIGAKHPAALGMPARFYWAELWNDLGPLLTRVRDSGETISAKDRQFYIERHGYGETVWFDISYSVVPDDDGSVGGVLCIVSETTQRVLADRRVRESERRFRALVEATADIVFRMSPDWTTMLRLDGQGTVADAEAALPGWIDTYIPEEDRERIAVMLRRAVARGEPFSFEHRVRLKSGAIGWMLTRVVPIADDAGTIVEWFGASADVTDRHDAEEHIQLVVNELNHRVKNNLAMVQSIAAQTFRQADDLAGAQDRFVARLAALAQANDLLTGERGARASLTGTVAQALGPHQSDPARLAVAGPDVQLTPKTALALSLALHELATNAVKYGAWSGAEGTVTLAWRVDRAESAPRLVLRWEESGGPAVVAPSRRGFGSRLIERGLAAEFGGTVTLAFPPGGLVCTVDAPLPAQER